MLKRTIGPMMAIALFGGSLWAANDVFVGKWKFNQSKSKTAGLHMKISAAGPNKYTFTEGGISDTVVADGTDQPVHYGRTLALSEVTPGTWKVVTKQKGRTLDTDTWTLSADGKTMTVDETGPRPDGGTFSAHLTAKRVAGTSGLAGTWQSTSFEEKSPPGFEIQAYEGDGLSFITPAYHDTLSMKFDGKDYPEKGPNVAAGSVSSGRRVNDHSLEITDKVGKHVTDTTEFKLSADGKTLTVTVHNTGESQAVVYAYDRE